MNPQDTFPVNHGAQRNPPEPRSRKPSLRAFLRISPIWVELGGYRWLLVVILALAWCLRALHPHFSSAFMDETIYVLYGRMFFARHFEAPIDQPLHFSFGWYLWPMMAALADRLGGLVGLRELAAALGTLTVLAVYGFARRLYSPGVGLASALIFAVLGPAVFASRIATRDVGAIFFFAVGLWLFVRAWQQNDWLSWLGSSLCFFAAFLSKYLVAIYFPLLVLMSLRKRSRAALLFALPLAVLCAAYAAHYRSDLAALLQYGRAYRMLKAPPAQAWEIYVTHRLDFWILAGISLFAWERGNAPQTRRAVCLWVCTAVIPAFQWFSRADYDYWKHVVYSFLFLTPLAMHALLRLIRACTGRFRPLANVAVVGLLALLCAWTGDSWRIDRFLFWPNAEPIHAFFEGRLAPSDRVLVDDSVLRYYFSPPLRQSQIADPFYFRYGDSVGADAYAAAVRDGWFDYIALDGGIGGEAKAMKAAIAPALPGRYRLDLSMPDPVLGQPIEICERVNPPAAKTASSGPQIVIVSPPAGAVAATLHKATTLRGVAEGAAPGDFVRVDVFTNRWYSQGGRINLDSANGGFSATVFLAGEGRQQCYHIVRARLFDPRGRLVAVNANFGIARANPDGSVPPCH